MRNGFFTGCVLVLVKRLFLLKFLKMMEIIFFEQKNTARKTDSVKI